MPPRILTLNAGSSSLRAAFFAPARLLSLHVDRVGLPGSRLLSQGDPPRELGIVDARAALGHVLDRVRPSHSVGAVAHRVVHGGPRHLSSETATPELLQELRALSPFDPEHLPVQIDLVEECFSRLPQARQIVCFDTAFHRDLPPEARLLPLPRRYEALGLRRYGFHGLAYASVLRALARGGAAGGRLVLAHLGNGASLAAVRDGRSVDTTMAFTPASGIPMSRRSGDLDPGIVAYLSRTEGMTPEGFQTMVNTESGLLGISDYSPDVRDLLAREKADPRCADALNVFAYQVRKTVGAFAAALGGLDGLVFSGGIGENSAEVRERICTGLEFLGVELDPASNSADAPVISGASARVAVRVIRADEEDELARAAFDLLGDGE